MSSQPCMQWDTHFSNHLGLMDQTHREFIEHYNAILRASPDAKMALVDVFIAHTQAHFDQENKWMAALPDFPPCHRAEHDRVLEVLFEVKKRTEEGDRFLFETLLKELPAWFESHVNGMDAALAFYMKEMGFDPETQDEPLIGRSLGEGCKCSVSASQSKAFG